MGLLFFIAIILLVYLYSQRADSPPSPNPYIDKKLSDRNHEWVSFIAGYAAIVKSKAEKQLLLRMLNDVKIQGLVEMNQVDELIHKLDDTHKEPQPDTPPEVVASSSIPNVSYLAQDAHSNHIAAKDQKPKEKDALAIKLDNISLLLYFGAFLFVASAGLFVSFADVGGTLRTLVVLFVTIVLYGSGVWIFRSKPALKPAGLAFAGIGMSMAPLIGLAAYNYVFTDSAPAVWFVTSALCLLLYVHSLFVLRKPLINYIFIFTLLSLFESGVAIIEAPIYYFGWAMALVAIVTQALSVWKNLWPDFQESSRISSQLFLPIAILVSLVLIGQEGVGQLGVSLLLAGLFYCLEAVRGDGESRAIDAVISHISLLSAIGCLAFSFSNSPQLTGFIIAGLAVVQTLWLLINKSKTELMQNFASVVMVSSLVSLAFLWQNPSALFVGTILTTIILFVIWVKQQRVDAYAMALLGWISLPLLYGQLVADPGLSITTQTGLLVASFAVHELFFISVISKRQNGELKDSARAMVIFHLLTLIVACLACTAGMSFGMLALIAVLMVALSIYDDHNLWSILSGGVMALSVIRSWEELRILPLAIFVSLAYNILLALKFRSEPNRWLSTLLWLLIPIGLGMSNEWSGVWYAWMYIVVAIALIISRAIARGVAFTSSKIPLAAYAKTASLSYVFGYITAGTLAVLISLGAQNSHLHTSLILGVWSILVPLVAIGVEKRADAVALMPVVWQLILLSVIRPNVLSGTFEAYLFLSMVLSTFCYVVSSWLVAEKSYKSFLTNDAVQVSLVTAFIVPISWIVTSSTLWPMPLGLLVSGAILFDYWRNSTQQNREISCGIIVASILWFMHFFGIVEIQAYTHVIALMFAGFAYWRSTLKDRIQSDNYLYWMLGTATIPLILQALSGEAGGLYGWWLLLEQIVFMMLGIAIRRKFVTMWGLYVAIGAVLYQLRNLGWAALTVLALFIIGVAVYQLQKYNKPDQ